jgi:hypothetical protein
MPVIGQNCSIGPLCLRVGPADPTFAPEATPAFDVDLEALLGSALSAGFESLLSSTAQLTWLPASNLSSGAIPMIAVDGSTHELRGVVRVVDGQVVNTLVGTGYVPTPLDGGTQLLLGDSGALVTFGGLYNGAPSEIVQWTDLQHPGGGGLISLEGELPRQVETAAVDASGERLLVLSSPACPTGATR